MEFEEMRKIWDTQNSQPMYVIDEQALHRTILTKKNRVNWLANINEIGMIVIAIATSTFLFFKTRGTENVYAFLPGIALLLTGVYVVIQRLRRKSNNNKFDQSILGTIDHAIANAEYLINFSKTFLWWYIVPIAVPVVLSMIMKGNVPLWTWLFIGISFIVSYLLVRWELNRCHLPRKKNLEGLKNKLMEEVENYIEGQ